MIQTIVADDEPLARAKLRAFLRNIPDVVVVGEARNGAEVVQLVRNASPQVVFLDVRMPGKDAFAIIDEISAESKSSPPRIIITTAYDQYALKAFDVHAVDYLLKPFTAERLHSALQRVREQIRALPTSTEGTSGMRSNGKSPLTRVVFKSRGRILFLRVSEIRWIAAEENYVRISTGNESHLLRETISSLEERLDPQSFLRIHRSAIVNLHFVKEIRSAGQGEFLAVLVNGQKIPMSRSYHARLGDLLGEWLTRTPRVIYENGRQGSEPAGD